MIYYQPVVLNNLSIIQQKVFELINVNDLSQTKLFYPPGGLDLFFNITELKTELDRLKWTDYIDAFAFYVIQKSTITGLHTDSGDRKYSFNIPIKNCENTMVNFYTSTEFAIDNQISQGAYYNHFKRSQCKLVDSLHMITPHVINVKEIHNVHNYNPTTRVTLLVRLKNSVELCSLINS